MQQIGWRLKASSLNQTCLTLYNLDLDLVFILQRQSHLMRLSLQDENLNLLLVFIYMALWSLWHDCFRFRWSNRLRCFMTVLFASLSLLSFTCLSLSWTERPVTSAEVLWILTTLNEVGKYLTECGCVSSFDRYYKKRLHIAIAIPSYGVVRFIILTACCFLHSATSACLSVS